jgi:G3E family GTPase|tara:strand:+ start:10951 stop:11109 length:159 start_codon:yes stop_codon:yes gene_type:complete
MHKAIAFVIGSLLGLGVALVVNMAHDVTIDQSAKIAEQGARIEKLEEGCSPL